LKLALRRLLELSDLGLPDGETGNQVPQLFVVIEVIFSPHAPRYSNTESS
jgi:hypothetical protein